MKRPLKPWTAALLVALCAGCGKLGSDTVPEAMLGTWVTAEPRYEECSFELTRDRITFCRGYALNDANIIRSVSRLDQGGAMECSIEYRNRNGDDFRLTLVYDGHGEQPTILFKNQKSVRWTRASAP